MPEPGNAIYLEALKRAIKARQDQLFDEGEVPGTGINWRDKLAVASDLVKFKDDCFAKVKQGEGCTGSFNLTGGKTLNLEISPTDGAKYAVSTTQGNVRRGVIKPD